MKIQSTRLAFAAAAMLLADPVLAADFYAGKTVEMVVGSGAGGGYDRYGRTVAKHIVHHIPGSPTMIVKNMPGAGSMKAADFIFNVAPKDGTAIAILSPGALVEPLFNSKDTFRFSPPKFSFIGSANSGTRLCVTFHTSKAKTFEDAQKVPVSMGGNAPSTSTTDYAQMLNNLAGAKFNIVNGYKSTSNILVAIERGELDGVCGFDAASFRAQRPAWYNTDKAQMLIQAGITPDPELEKLGVPSIWKYVKGRNREIAELIMSQTEFHRPFVAPPGMPSDRLELLRKAFDATIKDSAFLADAKQSKLDIAPKSGAEIAALVSKIYKSPKDIAEGARKAMGR